VIVAASDSGPDVSNLRDFLEGHGMARFKVPEQVAVWDTLPKNDAGKVLKHEIRATLAKAGE
jgi:cyclohexanecarboxylate-CoA ligase